MFYFVPSWYAKERPWYDQTPLWYHVQQRMTFDDTVNQVKMFANAEEDLALLVLNYQPQLRYFLHKQGLLGSHYWSLFDDIQNISLSETKTIDFKSLNWPSGVHFIYSPFAVVVRQGMEVIAHVHFAENGNLLRIHYRKDNRDTHHYIFDDRGFLSSIMYCDDAGQPSYQDYLNVNGIWQIREYLTGDKHLEINVIADQFFKKERYASWEELIAERLAVFAKQKVATDDVLVFAADHQHDNLILETFSQQQKVASFFNDRLILEESEDTELLLETTDLVITDKVASELYLKHLAQFLDLQTPVYRVTPYDTRLRLGHSQNIKELEVYYFIDTISEEDYQASLPYLLEEMERNPLVSLKIVSFDVNRNVTAMYDYLETLIAEHFEHELFYGPKEDGENSVDDEEELVRISIEIFRSEVEVIKALDTTRLVLDLGQTPDLYTQIASISAGVPQVNRVKTDYVDHQKNGWLISDNGELRQAFDWYFAELTRWNDALVYAIQKMADYTSGRILEQWKAYLKRN